MQARRYTQRVLQSKTTLPTQMSEGPKKLRTLAYDVSSESGLEMQIEDRWDYETNDESGFSGVYFDGSGGITCFVDSF
jgi:hypothetical protein